MFGGARQTPIRALNAGFDGQFRAIGAAHRKGQSMLPPEAPPWRLNNKLFLSFETRDDIFVLSGTLIVEEAT